MTENVQLMHAERSSGRAAGKPGEAFRAWKSLVWAEWYAHSRLLLIFLAVWLIAVWTLPLFTHAGWILLLGALYALIAGPVYGGGDVLEGCEEFTFSLPPTRVERFLARFSVGGATVLLLCSMNIAALGLDLPQMLAGLYVKTGAARPLPVLQPGVLYSVVLILPLTIFAFAFTISALTHSRTVILLSWFWAGLAALALLQLAFAYENLLWESVSGRCACPLLLTVFFATPAAGLAIFRRKEIGKACTPLSLPGYWWLWTILFALGLGSAAALISSLARNFSAFLRF